MAGRLVLIRGFWIAILLATVLGGPPVARGQERTNVAIPARVQAAFLPAQKRLIDDIEAFAARHARKGSPQYWAIVERNLHHLADIELHSGERKVGAPPPRLDASLPARLQSDPDYIRHIAAYVEKLKDGSRIFGGQPAAPGQFPEVVSLAQPICRSPNGGEATCSTTDVLAGTATLVRFHSFCSGTLVANDTVLTAGHCLCTNPQVATASQPVAESSFAVVFGTDTRDLAKVQAAFPVDRRSIKDADTPVSLTRAEHAKQCRDWNGIDGAHWRGRDVAMVKLKAQQLPLRNGVPSDLPPPAAIAAPSLLFGLGKPETTQDAVLAGFGLTETSQPGGPLGAQYFTRAEIKDLLCRKPEKTKSGCEPGRELTAVGGNPLAGKVRADTCGGDSGGPVFLLDGDGRRYLIASTSRGANIEKASAGTEHWGCSTGGIYSLVSPQVVHWLHIGNDVKRLRSCIAPGTCAELN